VKENVQGHNGIERLGRELERAQVGMDECRLRQAPARKRDLRLGNVDAGEIRALGQDARGFDWRTATELEHVRLGREQREVVRGSACAGSR
jgi:hypothetical protein